jgi:tetratricopeptide (TPR) repeat protein
VLIAAIEESQKAGDRRIELRARIEHEYIKLLQVPGTTADALLRTATEGFPIFETVGDNRALGRTCLLSGFAHGGYHGRHQAWEEAAERALGYYKSANWPTSTCLGEIAAALYYGPTPVPEAIARCEQLQRDEVSDQASGANVLTFLGGLVAQCGDFGTARQLIGSARETFEDLGQRTVATTYCGAVLGDVELLAGEAAAAERGLRELCEELERTRDFSHLASRAGDLAEAIYTQGHVDEAEEWARIAESHAAADDFEAQLLWRSVLAKTAARRGEFDTAAEMARDAVRIGEATDCLNLRARSQSDLGETLRLGESTEAAASAFARAVELYEQKGNLVGATHVRALRDDLALV